ncbi:MAG: hypothetical protein ACJ8CQ_01030, partial [Microvirga sp.]
TLRRRAVGTYSPRARAGFPVAAPVTWEHVEKGVAREAASQSLPRLIETMVARATPSTRDSSINA